MTSIYIAMIDEMIRFADFQDSVNDRLRIARNNLDETRKRHVNDLWSFYKMERP